MRIIDLLIKIASNETPSTIFFKNNTYWFDGVMKDYYRYTNQDLDDDEKEYLFETEDVISILNARVYAPSFNQLRKSIGLPEITYKKIEKLKDVIKNDCIEAPNNFVLMDKINEIIDKINLED